MTRHSSLSRCLSRVVTLLFFRIIPITFIDCYDTIGWMNVMAEVSTFIDKAIDCPVNA